ncbi:hypothetical protein KSP39_PZI008780 [Platanthera zijinensis]|uniref:Uncharacterized protein n=1 Tax=Platanthera zijinensis TaxID=2320716 RepID=A0AAP0BLG2_9ASPA
MFFLKKNISQHFLLYRDDIVLKDPLNTFAGIKNYKSIFCALRFIGPVLFKCLRVDIFCSIGRGRSSSIGWITSLEILRRGSKSLRWWD